MPDLSNVIHLELGILAIYIGFLIAFVTGSIYLVIRILRALEKHNDAKVEKMKAETEKIRRSKNASE